MPYIIECPEWHVLQALGAWVHKRKSKFTRQPVPSNDSPVDSQQREYSAKLFEVELLSLFRFNDGSRVLSASEFEECGRVLKTVCCHLDTLVHLTVHVLVPPPQGQTSSYPHLQRLIGLLADSKKTYDIVGGSNTPLFKLPENMEKLQKSLALVTQLNSLLAQLLTLPNSDSASYSPPTATRQEEGDWGDSWLRDRAIATFAALTKHSNCGKTHDQLLKLPHMVDGINTKPRAVLDVLMSSCSNNWLALQCGQDFLLGSSFPDDVNKIRCICGDLQTTAPGLCLVGLIEKNGELFGAWASSALNAVTLTPPEETLYQLISQGSFTPPSISSLKKPNFRFSKWEKRALAVRLGYCLMDFFDADLSSNRFHINRSLKEALYLSLTCKVNGSGDAYTFSIGHPALISLAKLLLEIEFGEVLPLDIKPHHEDNTTSWVQLFKKVDELEKYGFDEPKYLEAIRACLLVHSQIANALELGEQTRSTRDVTIRKNLYKAIVQKLVDVFRSMNSRQIGSRKRQRSASPEPIGRRKMYMAGRADSGDSLAGRPQSQNSSSLRVHMSDGRLSPRRGSPARQTTPLRSLMRSSTPTQDLLPSSGGIFEDYTPDGYTQEVCIAADKRIEEYRNFYDEAIQPEEESSAPRVKVAVLDTGLDHSTHSIQAYSERIVEVKSWLPPRNGLASNGTDKSGHGTHVTGLLLTMAPDCDIYVAQIADENGLIPPKDIAKAIEHAATTWEVDIISMSFGFTDERYEGCSDLKRAIIRAHAKGVLMFAAASNTGAHALPVPGPAFPARHTNVFCIYAGDGMGNSTRANPPIRKNRFNFLALGEAVESAWPMSLCENPWKKRKSGSSFATPIVAGVAASFLLYARQNLSEEDAEKCQEFDTMQRWLHHVSTNHQGYDVLSLSRFFSYNDDKRKQVLGELLDGLM